MAQITATIDGDGFDRIASNTGTNKPVSAVVDVESDDTKPDTGIENGSNRAETFGGFDVIDPASVGDARIDTGNQPKRRGRKPGTKNKPKDGSIAETAQTSNLIVDLEALLLSVHLMGASILSAPELELDKMEAKRLSDAINNVTKYYNFGIDPKKMAIAQLIFVCGGIYAPRAIAIAKRPKTGIKLVPAKPPAKEAEVMKPVSNAPKTVPLEGLTPSQLWDSAPIGDDTI